MIPKLQGVIPPLLTPLTADGSLDEPGLERLIEHVIAGGVHGLFLLGTTGEFACFDLEQRRRLIESAARCVRGRVPILVNVTDPSVAHSLRIAGWAAGCGAVALVLSPPYYYPITQEELLAYFQHLVPRLPLPVFLYNMPTHTKIAIDPPTAQAAMALDGVIGMKDSSGSMTYFQQVMAMAVQRRPDWSLLVGPEMLLAQATLMGGHGGVCGGANLAPRLLVGLHQAARNGDLPLVRLLQTRVVRLQQTIYTVTSRPSAFICGIKTALSVLGICESHVPPPHLNYGPAQRAIIERHIAELELTSELASGARP